MIISVEECRRKLNQGEEVVNVDGIIFNLQELSLFLEGFFSSDCLKLEGHEDGRNGHIHVIALP